MSRIVHFEMSAEDPERMAAFYSKVFGWTFQKWDGPMEYWMVMTGEGEPGINGGMMRREPGKTAQTVNTVGVESVDQTVDAISQAGGQVLQPKMPIPGVGYFAFVQDTEGNQFGLMQSDPAAA